MGRRDEYAETHDRGTLCYPDTIEAGDLIWYQYGWQPVTHTRAKLGLGVVYVFFMDQGESSATPEWKSYNIHKRARVRRKRAEAAV